jgi:type I restriction enzyme S subunit
MNKADGRGAGAKEWGVPRGYKQTEVGVIPEDWNVSTVGHEFNIKLGKMLDAEKNVGVPKPFLGNSSVQWGHIDVSDLGEIRLSPTDLQRFRLKGGDLLVCEGGDVGRAAIWRHQLDECYYQKALHRLRPKRGYSIELMRNLLERMSASGFLQNYVTQTSIAHLPKDKFETVPIPVPSTKAEQSAIAEALSDADALIESLAQLLAKKRDLKQGAMQELLTGKRRHCGFDGKKLGCKQTELGLIPADWHVRPISDLRPFVTSGSRGWAKYYAENGAPFIRITNLSRTNIYPNLDDLRFVKVDASDSEGVRTQLEVGDVLISITADIGIVGYVSSAVPTPAYINQHIALVRFDAKRVDSRFISYFLSSSAPQKLFKAMADSGAKAGMNLTTVQQIQVALPDSLAEQNAIADALSTLDTQIAALESQLTKARQLKQGMMQELLTGRIRLI